MLFTHNNINKKNLNSMLAIIIATIFLILTTPQIAFAADDASISVGAAGDVAPGNEFTIPVEIKGNPGFMGASFDIKYDTTSLELTNIDGTGGILSAGLIANVQGGSAGYINMTGNNSENGLLFNLTFKVKESASGGNQDIAVGLTDNLAQNFVNSDAKVVPVTFSAGNVSVTGDGSSAGNDSSGSDNSNTDNNSGGNTDNTNTPPKDKINVKNPDSSGSKANVGSPVFIEAEEGTLSWDTNMFDGVYDKENGGYVLTPKKSGNTPITYVAPNGEETTIDVEISDSDVPMSGSDKDNSAKNVIVPIIIVIVGIGAAVTVIIFLRKARKRA